ncbi:MAG: type II toxin-antitoxin system YafQ family toxin [Planctomycetes bacterium]|nr:type II toxin-antitoxin system YafQ family toxin [Planctomycetota bacterium]
MRVIKYGAKFARDLKRLQRSADRQMLIDLHATITLLANDEPLPEALKDHPLKGEWRPSRDCHVRPDLVLIYTKIPGELHLRRLGSHSELF